MRLDVAETGTKSYHGPFRVKPAEVRQRISVNFDEIFENLTRRGSINNVILSTEYYGPKEWSSHSYNFLAMMEILGW